MAYTINAGATDSISIGGQFRTGIASAFNNSSADSAQQASIYAQQVSDLLTLFSNDITENYYKDSFVGDGSTVSFAMSVTPLNDATIDVYVNGVYQDKSTYSYSGVLLLFQEAPPLGTSIEAINYSSLALPVYVVSALPSAAVAYQRFFVTDATATTFYSVVAGGGSSIVPVFSDGTDWRIG